MKKTLYTVGMVLMAIVLLVVAACNKNAARTTSTGTDSTTIPPEQTVTASLQGRVVDENGLPVQGAAVSSGAASTTTDVNGVFTFKGISMSSRFGFVKVSKTGYFAGSRSIITNPGVSNYVSIQLLPRTAKGTFPAAMGGTITVQTGNTAAFTASSVVTASTNAAYTGTVHVYATYLDPTNTNLYKWMPGDLRGIGKDGKETALQSFGMLGVELEGDAGEKLQIAAGQKATLTWAIPAALQATAPATIPLWYFNDSTGRWIEEGTATRQGNNYVGQVGHFSFWNCDAPMGTVNFKIVLKDQHGNPLPYTYIQFQSATYGIRGGFTDSSGFAQGLIPKGQTLQLQVVTECGNLLAGVNVGPALTDQDLGIITVNIVDAELIVTGTVVDCANQPVDSGFVNVQVDGLVYGGAVSKGVFSLPINRCFSSTVPVKLTAGDYQTLQVGSSTMITASTGTVDAGQLSACGNPFNQVISYTLKGITYNFTNPPDNFDFAFVAAGGFLQIAAQSADGSGKTIDIYAENVTGAGIYNNTSMTLSIPGLGVDYGIQGGQINVTGWGPVNGFITGSISGNIYDSISQKTYPMTGTIRVLRTQ